MWNWRSCLIVVVWLRTTAAAGDERGDERWLRARRGPLEPAGQEMRRRDRVLGRGSGGLLREVGREALVEQLDGDVHGRAQRVDEALRLGRLLATLAAQRQRQADDDPFRLFLVA